MCQYLRGYWEGELEETWENLSNSVTCWILARAPSIYISIHRKRQDPSVSSQEKEIGSKSETRRLTGGWLVLYLKKWLGFAGSRAANYLKNLWEGRVVNIYQSSERMAHCEKMSAPYGVGDESVLGKLFSILNSPAGWDLVGVIVSQRRKFLTLLLFLLQVLLYELAYGISDVRMNCNLCLGYLQLEVIYLAKKKKKRITEYDRDLGVFKGNSLLENKLWHSDALPKIIPNTSISTVPLQAWQRWKWQGWSTSSPHASVVSNNDIICYCALLFQPWKSDLENRNHSESTFQHLSFHL